MVTVMKSWLTESSLWHWHELITIVGSR